MSNLGSGNYFMKSIQHIHLSYWRLIVPTGITFAVVSQLYSTVCGLGLTFDSNMYLEGARYLQSSELTWAFNHLIFQYKPPLYPLLLAVFSLDSMRVVNTILLSLTLLSIAILFDAILKSRVYKTLGFLIVASFTPLIMVHVYLWTEPLFLFILFGSILLYVKYYESKDLTILIVLGVLSIFLSLIRHVGIFFILGYFLAILLDNSNKKWKAFLYLVIGSSGFVIWNLLIMVGGFYDRILTFSAPIRSNSFVRLDNIFLFLNGSSLWILPNNLPAWFRISVLIALIILLSIGLFKVIKRNPQSTLKGFVIIIVTYYILMHLAFKLYISSEERYLVPIFPLFILVALSTIEVLKEKIGVKFSIVKLIIFLWLFYPVVRTVKNAMFWHDKNCVVEANK
jgi:hypothetical protein